MISSVVRHPLFLCTLSGLLLALSFPAPDFELLAFVGLVPILIAVKNSSPWQAFRRGLGAGFVYFVIVLSWVGTFASTKIGNLGEIAWFALAIVEAFFVGLFAAVIRAIPPKTPSWLSFLAIPSIWVLCEYVRQLGSLGMGWGDLGYTQWRDPLILRIAPFTGIWGLSWVVVLVNVTIVRWNRQSAILAGSVVAGFWLVSLLSTSDVRDSGPTYTAAALQANIDQDVYWTGDRPSDPAYFESTLSTFDQMADQAAGRDHAKLLLLAETAAPGYPGYDMDLVSRLSAITVRDHAALLTGARDTDMLTRKDLNIAALLLPDKPGKMVAQYAKQQLVPFGEFVPFQDQLQWISVLRVANFNDEPGSPTQPPLDAKGLGKIGVGICYESTYPRFLRQQTLSGANILTVVTDDTWFGRTSAARQHLAMSAIRAAESDRYLVRCAATGISAIFAPDGRELTEAGLFTKAIVAAPVTPRSGMTWFVRYGDWFVIVCAVLSLLALWRQKVLAQAGLSAEHLSDPPDSRLREAEVADRAHHA